MKKLLTLFCLLLFLSLNSFGQGLPPLIRNPMSTNGAVSVPLNLEVPRWNGTAWDFVTMSASGVPTTNLIQSLSSTNGFFIYTVTANGNTNAFFVLTNTPSSSLTGIITTDHLTNDVAFLSVQNIFSGFSNSFKIVSAPAISMGGSIFITNNGNGGVRFYTTAAAASTTTKTLDVGANGVSMMDNSGSQTFNLSGGSTAANHGLSFVNTAKFGGVITTNGIASYSSNLLAWTSITVGGSPFSWTNTLIKNVFVAVDGAGVSVGASINGTSIYTALAGGDFMLPIQPGEYATLTYTIGAPGAKFKPF